MNIIIGLVEHIGDIVACEPVARYLRKKHPRAKISWVVNEKFRELIDSNPNIDITIPVKCLTEWIVASRHGRYDLVVDLHVNHRICHHCKVPLVKEVGNPHVNVFEWFDYGAILEAFSQGAGLPKLSGAPKMYPQRVHVEAVDKLMLGERYCVIHRVSNAITKDWDDDKWKLLVKWINKEFGLKVVEVGNGETPWHRGFPSNYVSLINRTSLLETAEVIRRATLFIGIDSACAHFANAFEVPGVILLGRLGHFRKYNPYTGFYAGTHPTVRIVRNLLGAVQEIPFEEVCEAANYILKYKQEYPQTPAAFLNDDNALEDGAGFMTNSKSSEQLPHVLAFYLPQFHPIAENNAAHGVGFTEWTNVIKAKPTFKGHYQPRVPGELGYYDLRSLDVMRTQIDLAIEYGLTGFCFYYYYFAGKKILYSPIENFIKSNIDFPFCFLWANENWSKRWDGGDKEVIIQQVHSKQDDEIFINDLIQTFTDKRYIKVDGKPILMVYKPHLFETILQTTELWRAEAEKAGLPGLYLVMVDDWNENIYHPREMGFDASYEIPSNLLRPQHHVDEPELYSTPAEFGGKLVDYQKFAQQISARPQPRYKRFKTVMAPWDNTPRYGMRAQIYVNYNNDAYRSWMTKAYLDTYRRFEGDERLMFVHSWNEWCEGTYIEPDGKLGRRYLEQTRDGIEDAKNVIKYSAETGLNLDTASIIRRIDRQTEDTLYYQLQIARSYALHQHILHVLFRSLPMSLQDPARKLWRALLRRKLVKQPD